MELELFLDSDTVKKFDLREEENGGSKEAALARLEMEELGWREAGKFTAENSDEAERILGSLLTHDERGNPIPQKPYA